MGLRITLKPGERVILNGCIVRNAGRSRMDIEVENRSDVLRGDEIISREDACTPVRGVAHAIQHALASRDQRDELLPHILRSLDEIEAVLNPVVAPAIHAVRACIGTEDYYGALKSLGPLLDREARLLNLSSASAAAPGAAA